MQQQEVFKWEDFLKTVGDLQEVQNFLEKSREIVLEQKDQIQKNLNNIVHIDKLRAILYDFLSLQTQKVNAEGAILYVLDENRSGEIFFKPYSIVDKENADKISAFFMGMSINYEGSVLAYSIANKKVIYVRELDPVFLISEQSKKFYEILPIKSHITIPLFLEESPVGVVQFYSQKKIMDISDEELSHLFQSSYSLAMVLKAIVLYEKMLKNYNYLKKMTSSIKEEMVLAKKIQENLLPKDLPKIEKVKIEFWYKPMEEIGGDFFDFLISREKDKVGVLISDVAGHGVPSALITTMIKALITSSRIYLDRPKQLISKINYTLFTNNSSNFFVTAFYMIINLVERKLYYTNASHNPPILYRRNKEEFHLLEGKGKFLGIFSDITWEEKYMDIQSGDRIVLYTDGILEMVNSQGEEFGMDNLLNILKITKNLDIVSAKKFLQNTILNYENSHYTNDDKVFIMIDIM